MEKNEAQHQVGDWADQQAGFMLNQIIHNIAQTGELTKGIRAQVTDLHTEINRLEQYDEENL
tara:strand:+ start:2605 stop:2790 length:186 start_codon:yes stop_codon:yes gene_type:complete